MHAWYLTRHDLCVKLVMAMMTFTHLLVMEVQLKMATTDLEFDKQIPGRSAHHLQSSRDSLDLDLNLLWLLRGPRAKSPLAPPALIKSVHIAA